MSSAIDIRIKKAFLDLVCRLTPENLSQDGELPAHQVAVRRRQIAVSWRALEAEVRRRVSEDDAWSWSDEVLAHEEAERARLAAPAPGGLRHPKPTLWVRDGANGQSAYYVQNWNNGLGFRLYSEFGTLLERREHLGDFPSLAEAEAAGEEYLRGVTAEAFRQKTRYSDANIARCLERLPLDVLQARRAAVQDNDAPMPLRRAG